MFVVKRCVRDYEDVWKTVIGEFILKRDAVTLADEEDDSNGFRDVWFEVEEE